MRVLITGASGLIGRHTAALLREHGLEVSTFHRGAALPGFPDHVAGDVTTDRDLLCEAARGCAAVVHLAGRGDVGESRRDPLGYVRLNATGTLHALDAARGARGACIFASTQRVYSLRPTLCREDDPPEPDSPYGYAKWGAELWCRMMSEQYGVPTTVLRFFSVYGPGQQVVGQSSVVTIFARAALAHQPLTVQSAGQRDFTDARDAARGILLALLRPPAGGYRLCNLATGVGTSFRALADLLVELTGSRSEVVERLAEGPERSLVPDISRAGRELGFEPTISLREGLEHYLASLRGEAVSSSGETGSTSLLPGRGGAPAGGESTRSPRVEGATRGEWDAASRQGEARNA